MFQQETEQGCDSCSDQGAHGSEVSPDLAAAEPNLTTAESQEIMTHDVNNLWSNMDLSMDEQNDKTDILHPSLKQFQPLSKEKTTADGSRLHRD